MLFIRDHLKKTVHLGTSAQANWKRDLKREAIKLLKYLEAEHNRSYGVVTLVLLTPAAIDALAQKFNSEKAHAHTDVLTFSYTETDQDSIEGDILLCPEHIFTLATADNRPHGYALIETALHGMLHLYGLRHTYSSKNLQKVYQTQDTILNNSKLNWIKIDELVQSL